MEIFKKGLPKWPALVVRGKPVTKDQAKEILIRTDGLFFSTNDREFEKEVNEYIYGVAACEYELYEKLKEKGIDSEDIYGYPEKVARERYKIIGDLYYLSNKQIMSCWVGGPHGWCNWSGYIGTNNYNIGKWPSIESVFEEWKIIAEAFPFLDLKSQLFSGETCEEDIEPVVEFHVKNGGVLAYTPNQVLDYPNGDINFNILDPRRERGISFHELKIALDYVENKYKK